MSNRQWVILQQALLNQVNHPDQWDNSNGPAPSQAEIDEIVELLDSMTDPN